MAEIPVNTPQLGSQGETCAQCGAPLAPDQRYCLSCGTRRADARLPFRDVLAPPTGGEAGSVSASGAAPPPPAGGRGEDVAGTADRARANLALVAGLGCLLLALGVGILIGRSGHDNVRQAAPQVISVGSGAPAATTPSGTGAGGSGTDAGTTGRSGSGGAAKKKKGNDAGAASPKQSKATNKALQDLQNASPQDYQKQSQKLPSKVGTGGAPPPVDKSKPAGAGTSFQEIG